MLRKFWGNTFIRGGAIFTIASFFTSFINYLFNLLSARALGPSGFGEITTLFSYATIFSVPTVVVSLVIIGKIGSRGKNASSYSLGILRWFLSRLKYWSWLGVLVIFIIPFVPKITNLSVITGYFLIPLVLFTFIGAFYAALLQGLQLFTWFSIISILAVSLKLFGAVLVTLGIDGLLTIVFFLFLSFFIPLILSHKLITKHLLKSAHSHSYHIQKRVYQALWSKQLIITLFSILAITMFNNIDVIYAKKILSAHDAGIYSSWSLFAKIIIYFVGPLSSIAYIFFSDKDNEKHQERVLFISLALLVIIGFMSYIFYSVFSLFFIRFFFGPKYDSVAPFLTQASIFGSLYALVTFMNNYFISKNSMRALLLLFAMPVYIIALITISKSMSNIIMLNVIFAAIVTLAYFIACVTPFIYNSNHGKKK